jgi:hypothetical protein
VPVAVRGPVYAFEAWRARRALRRGPACLGGSSGAPGNVGAAAPWAQRRIVELAAIGDDVSMDLAQQAPRLIVDDLTFALATSELTVTPLPWGELSLDLTVRGNGNGWCRSLHASLEDVRVRGRSWRDLDGCVLEAAQGWLPDPDGEVPNSVITPYHLYIDGHFELIRNRVVLRCLDDDRVRVAWTAATETHINHYCRRDMHSEMVVDVCAHVKVGEYHRLKWFRTEGLDEKTSDRWREPHRTISTWLEQEGRSRAGQGWFEGRSFQRVDIIVVFGPDLSLREPARCRMEMRHDRMLRVRVPAPLAALRTQSSAQVAALLQQLIERALSDVAAAFPAAPSLLR